MVDLNLSVKEEDILSGLIDTELSTLHSEILHTDNRSFRDDLKQKKAVLLEIRDKLKN